MALFFAALLAAATATAQPIGPDVPIPGFDQEQARTVFDEGARRFAHVVKRHATEIGIHKLTARATICGVAQMMQNAILTSAADVSLDLLAPKMAGVRRALHHLKDIENRHCDRPPGGAAGTGNEGDRLVKAFLDASAPQAKGLSERLEEVLIPLLESSAAAAARDAMLAAAVIAAGLASAPLWAPL